MNQIRETISNYDFDPRGQYCRQIIRGKLAQTKATTIDIEELSIKNSLVNALRYTDAEEKITDALCSNFFNTEKELEGRMAASFLKVRNIVAHLASSREYALTRTSPKVNKLNEIWVASSTGIAERIDINRVHRNFFYDISSVDSVEDYIYFAIQKKSSPISKKPDLQLPAEVIAFCDQKGLKKYIAVATDLLGKYFPAAREIQTELEIDPEAGEKWVSIELSIQATVEEVLREYEQFTGEWASLVPWPERHMIRLFYNIL